MKEKTMKKSIQGLYLASLSALGLIAVTLRTVALITGFDFTSGYFTRKLANNISAVVAVTAIVLFATFLIYKKNYRPTVGIGMPRDYIASACVGVALIVMAAEIAISIKPSPSGKVAGVGDMITLAAAVLAAIAALYFISSVLFGKGAPRASAVFSIALMLYLVCYALLLYFDSESPINSPVKLCDQMAYVALAIFFVYETRISLARPMWRMYVVSGLSAALLSAYSAIPSLIVYFAKGEVISHTVSESILTLALFAFVLVRVISALTAEEDRENEIVGLVKNMHALRIKEIEEARASRAQCNNNEESAETEDDNYEIEIPDAKENDAQEGA